MLLFDNSTMDFGDQARARQAATKFIESNGGPNRLMAIANFGGSLQIAQNFTEDTDRLKKVVNGIKFSAVAPNASDANAPAQLNTAMASFGARDVLYAFEGPCQESQLHARPQNSHLYHWRLSADAGDYV